MNLRAAGAIGLATGALCAAVTLQASRPAPGVTTTPVLPERLEDTGLFVPGQPGVVDPRIRTFAPQYALWSDGLRKTRWLYLPDGATIDASNPLEWRYPVGTRFWKDFSLGERRVETRMLWLASDAGWLYASYVWNEGGTEAVLAPDGGIFGVVEHAPGRRYTIPSRTDCATCHGAPATGGPIGFNLLQLSEDRDPNALHGEPLRTGMLTARGLVDEGLLANAPRDLDTHARIRTDDPATRSVLGYMVANCAMCHNGRGEITAAAPLIRLEDLVTDADTVARSLVGQRTKWQAPGASDGTVLVHAGQPDASALLLRMRSRSPSSQMPPLGSVVRDQAAVDAVTRWIADSLLRSH